MGKKSVVETAICGPYVIQRLQDGTITITRCSEVPRKLKPVLREFAKIFDVSLLNSKGNPRNTRQLGREIIKAINAIDFR